MSIDYDFWQRLWDEHAQEYIAECRSEGIQADLSSFQVWAEEKGLVPDDEVFEYV